ncbi:MAG: hypothetical protein COA93_11505 [Alphaproteobacteria bacterium]|nr:MAG: hypothetical protein COA93_11505 [Alphaproteobacteria bacterium]
MIRSLFNNFAWLFLGIGVLIIPIIFIIFTLKYYNSYENLVFIKNSSQVEFKNVILSNGRETLWSGIILPKKSEKIIFPAYYEGQIQVSGDLRETSFQCFGSYISSGFSTTTDIVISPAEQIKIRLHFEEEKTLTQECKKIIKK